MSAWAHNEQDCPHPQDDQFWQHRPDGARAQPDKCHHSATPQAFPRLGIAVSAKNGASHGPKQPMEMYPAVKDWFWCVIPEPLTTVPATASPSPWTCSDHQGRDDTVKSLWEQCRGIVCTHDTRSTAQGRRTRRGFVIVSSRRRSCDIRADSHARGELGEPSLPTTLTFLPIGSLRRRVLQSGSLLMIWPRLNPRPIDGQRDAACHPLRSGARAGLDAYPRGSSCAEGSLTAACQARTGQDKIHRGPLLYSSFLPSRRIRSGRRPRRSH